MTKLVIENSFTIVSLESGANVSFNHSTLTVRYTSANGSCYLVEHDDEDWVDVMNRYKLWR